jgi:hypothetical protein
MPLFALLQLNLTKRCHEPFVELSRLPYRIRVPGYATPRRVVFGSLAREKRARLLLTKPAVPESATVVVCALFAMGEGHNLVGQAVGLLLIEQIRTRDECCF